MSRESIRSSRRPMAREVRVAEATRYLVSLGHVVIPAEVVRTEKGKEIIRQLGELCRTMLLAKLVQGSDE